MARVLVIDDDEDVREMLALMVGSAGHEVVAPRVGPGLRPVVAAGQYDVVVTDVLMPELDGIEVIKLVRAARPACPIIAISGGSPRMPASVGLKLTEAFGANVVLYKPFERDELIEAIEQLCRAVPSAAR
ncbi:MAG: response regulator [Alphaproteobacteria bacterium]|nr:response regulator [Alphaproteobacteria bacterium]